MNMMFDTVETNTGNAVVQDLIAQEAVANEAVVKEPASEDAEAVMASASPDCADQNTNASQDSDAKLARYHSLLAMAAARKMRRTRQKQKTGQEVCHHLKMMLAEPLPERHVRSRSQFQLGF